MLALTRQEATRRQLRILLQELFRSTDTVKLGFGLEGDLSAIARALGTEGGGCVARVNMYIDVKQLHAYLRHAGTPVPSASGAGLTGALPMRSAHYSL